MSVLSTKTEHLCSVIDEIKAISDDLDSIDLSAFDRLIVPSKRK